VKWQPEFAAGVMERYDKAMSRPSSSGCVCLLLWSIAVVSAHAQQSPAPQRGPQQVAKSNPEALIDALTSYPFGAVYSEDINQPNSITYAGKKSSEDSDRVIPASPVRNIADLGQAAIPLLISHLTDQRPAQATYHDQPVPLAYLALDMLLHMTDVNDERVAVPGCEQHGLGDCMQPDFYFSPDITDPNTLASVQKSWAEENKRQPIKFVYPTWWLNPEAPPRRPLPPGTSPKSKPQAQ